MRFVHVYFNDICIATNCTYEDHITKLSLVLDCLNKKGMAVNAHKSFWATKSV